MRFWRSIREAPLRRGGREHNLSGLRAMVVQESGIGGELHSRATEKESTFSPVESNALTVKISL